MADSESTADPVEMLKRAIIQHWPDAQISDVAPRDLDIALRGAKLRFQSDNFLRACALDRTQIAAEIERQLALLEEMLLGGSPGLEDIIPVLRSDSVIAQVREQALALRLLWEPFVADMVVLYALDSASSIRYVDADTLAKLDQDGGLRELPNGRLRTISLKNLFRRLPPVQRHGAGPVYMLTAGADHVSSLLLFDTLWEEIARTQTGHIFASTPTRDIVYYASDEGLLKLRDMTDAMFAKGSNAVSNTILERSNGQWRAKS